MKNVGKFDRYIRITVAAALILLQLSGTLTGTYGIVALVIAAIMLLTSLIGFCPLYSLFGMNTCPRE